MKGRFDIRQLLPLISWEHFFYAWDVHRAPQAAYELKADADQLLRNLQSDFHVSYLLTPFEVKVNGDDLMFCHTDQQGRPSWMRIPFLRQQVPNADGSCICLTDYIGNEQDKVYLFATSTDVKMEHLFEDDPYRQMLAKTLADRLAEAAADLMQAQSGIKGIRPAVGYPSIPDMSINFLIDELIDFSQIGIHLTEHGMMQPHASVSGLLIPNPEASYFSIRKISEEQLADYARRRGFSTDVMRTYIAL